MAHEIQSPVHVLGISFMLISSRLSYVLRRQRKPIGFTMVEIIIVIVMVGVLALLALPKLNTTLDKVNAAGARSLVAEMVSKARFAAIQRSGTATLNITPDGHAWVTAPKVGALGSIDTVGTVENLVARFGVSVVAPTAATSLGFDAQGVGTAVGSTVVILSSHASVDTLTITASGRTSSS